MSSELFLSTVENVVHALYQIAYVLLIVFSKQSLGKMFLFAST